MMRVAVALLSFACLVSSSPISGLVDNSLAATDGFAPEYPGFDLNLRELRRVQLSPDAEPVWWTELQKVSLTQNRVDRLS